MSRLIRTVTSVEELPSCPGLDQHCICSRCSAARSPSLTALLLDMSVEITSEPVFTLGEYWSRYEWHLEKHPIILPDRIPDRDNGNTSTVIPIEVDDSDPLALSLYREHMTRVIREIMKQDNLKPVDREPMSAIVADEQEIALEKRVTTHYEGVIHRQLCSLLYGDVYLAQLVPSMYGIGDDLIYLELIPGQSLHQVLSKNWRAIDCRTMTLMLIILHSLLDYLNKSIGFVHGDLHWKNIMLRGYGSDKTYQVPILSTDGSYSLIDLPFVPVLIDFGLSRSTRYNFSYSSGCFSTPLVDVWRLYGTFSVYGCTLFRDVYTILESLFGRGWAGRQSGYLPPIPVDCLRLSHSRVIEMITPLLKL